MKIKRVQMIIVGLITLTLSSCGAHTRPLKEADKAVTLEVLNPKVEISIEFEQMVKEYEKENPNINVEILTFGGELTTLMS